MIAMLMSDSEYNMGAAFDRIVFAVFAFALKRSGQTKIIEVFLEDPAAGLRYLAKDLQTPRLSPWLSDALVRGREIWGLRQNNWLRSIETIPEDFWEALDYYKDPYARSCIYKFYWRRLFRTTRSYLGLGTCNMEPGDQIYIVQGASVPYIFRPISESPADGFKLIGEVYVHGIMYGEAVANGPPEYKRIEVH